MTRRRRIRGVLSAEAADRRHPVSGCALVALVAAALVLAAPPATGEAEGSGTSAREQLVLGGPYDPYDPVSPPGRSLELDVPGKLTVGRRATVVASGTAFADDQLSVFVDPKGKACPASAESVPRRMFSVVSEAPEEGGLRERGTYLPRRAGERTFCGYLGGAPGRAEVQASEKRRVTPRRLRESIARREVVDSLRRHGFARRVVKSLRVDCRRTGPSAFACRFSDGIPAYRLMGRGQVRLGVDLSYRFRVTAQGVRFTLTDENEDGGRK